jgi:AraC-type transcriptional regulator N-terminus
MKKLNKSVTLPPDRAHELRMELARRIASFVGSAEKLVTDIPGLMLTRRTAPTAPASAAYEPSLAVVAQGRKRATLGGTTFIFDPSRCLLPAHGPAELPAGHSVSERPDSTRDHVSNPAGTGGGTPSSDCNAGRSEPTDGKGDRVGQDELCEAVTGGSSRKNRGHGRVHAAPPFPGADRLESASVSEATSAACSAGTHAHGWSGRRQCGIRGRIRERQPIQSRIQPLLRPTAHAGYSDSSLSRRSSVGIG